MFPLSQQFLGLLVAAPNGSLGISIVDGDVRAGTSISAAQPVCNFGVDKLSQPIGRDDYVTPSSHLVVLTSTDGTSCEIEVANTGAAISFHTLVGVTATPGTHAWFARLEPPGLCPSLLVKTMAGMVEAKASGAPNACTTSGTAALTNYPNTFTPLGHVVVDPAAADAIVTTMGIITIDSTGASNSSSTRRSGRWTRSRPSISTAMDSST